MDEVHLKGEHIKLKEKGKKGDIVVNKINVSNVVRKGILLEIANAFTNNDSEEEGDFQSSFAIESSKWCRSSYNMCRGAK